MNLLPDAVEFVKTLKQTAVDAVEAEKPVNVCFGEVVSISPLKINVEQKLVLGETQLILTRSVTDYETKVTVDWTAENATLNTNHTHTGDIDVNVDISLKPDDNELEVISNATGSIIIDKIDMDLSHNHVISGEKKMIIHNGLAIGDVVILIRQQKGQKYIVIDRIGVMR